MNMNSKYAAVTTAGFAGLLQPYSVTWEFERYNADGSTTNYTGLEEVEFTTAQENEIVANGGTVPTDAEGFLAWVTEFEPEPPPR